MRVGILTFHLVPNFGAYLQAWCMVQALRQLGHEAEIINYENPVHRSTGRFKPWVYRRPGRLWHDFRKRRIFSRAFDRLPLSAFASDPGQVNWNAYDAIIVGSDIVWNCESALLGRDPVYFGQFPTPYRGRLVAYAPSIGSMKPDFAAPEWVAEGLRRFKFTGVRDTNTQDFVQRQTGLKPPLVLDPTWLFEGPEVGPQEYSRRTSRDFLLVYSFPLSGRAVDEARAFAQKHGLLTVGVGYWQRWCEKNWATVDPFEWDQLIRQARYVLSGTFHGTLYCIREQKSFCLLANEGSDSKVATPLFFTGLQDRRTTEPAGIEQILLKPVDYQMVSGKINPLRQESLTFLKQALS
jgi:Polysaccharide pyruvyl transferase